MAKKILGNHDGRKGGNDTYTIPGRGTVPRIKTVREVKKGKHPGFTTTIINGQEYVKGKPNNTENDNVNQE